MRVLALRALAFFSVLAGVAACGSRTALTELPPLAVDSGLDARPDAAPDAPLDVPFDLPLDAPAEAEASVACVLGAARACYSGPAGTEGVGPCHGGTQRCLGTSDGGAWGPCEGELLPTPDPCDGMDHLCLGRANPACPCVLGQTQPCYEGPTSTRGVGLCHAGVQTCGAVPGGSRWGACVGQQLPEAPQCDGLDHACTGMAPGCEVRVTCPAAVTTRVGRPVALRASATSGPPATLTMEGWTVETAPMGATATLTPPTGETTLFQSNLAGSHTVRFTARNSAGRSATCTVPVTVLATYLGTEFWAVTTANSQLLSGDTFHFALAIGNPNATPVTVTVTGGALTAPLVFSVPAMSAGTQVLPWVTPLVQNFNTLTNCPVGCCDSSCCPNTNTSPPAAVSALARGGAYHVRTTQPVSAYQFNALEFQVGTTCRSNSYTNDASLLLPAPALTGNYLVLAHNAWATLGSFAAIVGAGTGRVSVDVTLSTDIVAGTGVTAAMAGTTQRYELDPGDVVQLVSTRGTRMDRRFLPQDMTGTVIRATGPVAVVAGVDCTFMSSPDGTVSACDHIEQQLFPEETWGSDVLVSQLQDRGAGENYMVRIMAREDGTTLTFTPASVHAPVTLARGRFVEFESAADFEVVGSRPILVAQYMESQNTTPGEMVGDPAMVLEVPTTQYRRDYNFVVPASYTASFFNVVARAGAVVRLDGVALAGTPSPVAGTSWTVWRQPVTPGAHRIETEDPDGFALKVLGVAERTSYAYPGGLDLVITP